MSQPSKIVLAYSGGLDTSVILKWLQDRYQCPVVTFTADLGQGEEVESVRPKAEALGVEEIFIFCCAYAEEVPRQCDLRGRVSAGDFDCPPIDRASVGRDCRADRW